MLKIHKLHSKKLFIMSITSILSIGALLGFSVLTYTPELSHAETVDNLDHRTMADITYMQEITPTICSNTPESDAEGNNQYQLKDSRDQKTYWVAKLKDGNCWMTQNLGLSLNADTPLTPENTDTDEIWIPSASTLTQLGDEWAASVNASRATAVTSYRPGEYVYTTPSSKTKCGNDEYGELAPQFDVCLGFGWKRVNNLSVTSGNKESHYLIGSYYTWAAATMESGNQLETNYAVAKNSICPKNWKIADYYEYVKLRNGITSVSQLTIAPYYFLRGGWIVSSVSGVYIQNAGASSYDWTSSVYDSSQGYSFMFSDVSNMKGEGRQRGMTVRCISGIEINNDNVEIAVNSTISLDVTSEAVVEKSETNPSTANFDVKVASNQPYKVQISASSPNLTSSTTSTTIPSRSGTLNTNVNGWGIKLSTVSTYTQITSTPTTFYTATGAEVKTVPFTVGISTSPDLPNGEYSTDITVTATQN